MPESDDRLSQIRESHGKCNPSVCDQAWLLAYLEGLTIVLASGITVHPQAWGHADCEFWPNNKQRLPNIMGGPSRLVIERGVDL